MKRLLASSLLVAGAALAHPPPGVPTLPETAAPTPPTLGGGARLDQIQSAIAQAHLDGWLLYDDQGLDPRALELVHPSEVPKRRWFYLIPPAGAPTALVARGDGAAFETVPGHVVRCRSWQEMDTQLKSLLRGRHRVAMAYSPHAAAASLGRVDAATVELVRSTGVVVAPSAFLVNQLESRWSEAQRAGHLYAAHRLAGVKDQLFRMIAERLGRGGHVNEYELQVAALRAFAEAGLESEVPALVAAGANSADPDYLPTARRSSEVKAGDVVVLGLVARQAGVGDAVYADLSWVGLVGETVPARVETAFAAVREARDRAVGLIQERRGKQLAVAGWEIDDAARAVLDKAGFADKALLPSGHGLGRRARGVGPTFDNQDVHDDRTLLPHAGAVVSPSLFFAGEFGVRSACDLHLGEKDAQLTSTPQATVELIRLPGLQSPYAQPAPPAVDGKSGSPANSKTPVKAANVPSPDRRVAKPAGASPPKSEAGVKDAAPSNNPPSPKPPAH